MPNHMMVFLLSNEQMSNQLNKNPFFFSPRGLKEVCLLVDGQTLPSERMTLDVAAGDYKQMYSYFMDNIGMKSDCENGLSPSEYVKSSFALAYDLTPDLCLNNHSHETEKTATIDIRLIFSEPTTIPLTILYVMTYDDTITLYPDKKVKVGTVNNQA